jgi:predicted dehydrogenase
MEGFHYLFHPVMQRLFTLLDHGELGDLVRVEALIAMPEPDEGDPRWSFELAGGALMDLGCYGLHAHRALGRWAGGEPVLLGARAKERDGAPGVDEWLEAELRFPSGATGSVRCSMAHPRFEMTLSVGGTRGKAVVVDFVQPHKDDRVVVRTLAGTTTEHHGTRSSYIYQLEAFIAALCGGTPMPTGPDDAVATAELIDNCYRAAGLPLRARSTSPTGPR